MKRIITRRYTIVLGVLVALACAAGIVWATSPHFVGKAPSTVDVDATGNCTGDVDVSFKESGLGANVSIDYVATATANATYVCVNGGGQCPDASNKTTVTGPVTSPTTTLTSGKNGNIEGSVTLSPPSVTPFCPSGQDETLAVVTYTKIKIKDVTNDVILSATPSSAGPCTVFTCP